jgi:hypothetical protein
MNSLLLFSIDGKLQDQIEWKEEKGGKRKNEDNKKFLYR